MIDQLGFVQLDSIAAVERAHHLTLRSRLPGYQKGHLAHLLEAKRSLFEHWTHDASAIPVAWRHHWKHRFTRYAESDRAHSWWSKQMGDDPNRAIRQVLRRIRAEGPLRSRDFEQPREPTGGWWNWKPTKAALEYLWRSGRIAVTRRDGFQKVYDLSSRVHPDTARQSSNRAHLDWACREAIDRLGVATASEIAAYFRAVSLGEVRQWITRAQRQDNLISVRVQQSKGGTAISAFALPTIEQEVADAMEAPLLHGDRTLRLLCPFDPVIRDRARLERLFGFAYRFEAFVPKAKRRYGYYVLPILRGDALIGRADLKTDRAANRLLVQGVWWEDGIRPTASLKRLLQRELQSIAAFVGVNDVSTWT